MVREHVALALEATKSFCYSGKEDKVLQAEIDALQETS